MQVLDNEGNGLCVVRDLDIKKCQNDTVFQVKKGHSGTFMVSKYEINKNQTVRSDLLHPTNRDMHFKVKKLPSPFFYASRALEMGWLQALGE